MHFKVAVAHEVPAVLDGYRPLSFEDLGLGLRFLTYDKVLGYFAFCEMIGSLGDNYQAMFVIDGIVARDAPFSFGIMPKRAEGLVVEKPVAVSYPQEGTLIEVALGINRDVERRLRVKRRGTERIVQFNRYYA